MKVKCAKENEEWEVQYVCPTHWIQMINEHAGRKWKCGVCGGDLYVHTHLEGEDEIVDRIYCPRCRYIVKMM